MRGRAALLVLAVAVGAFATTACASRGGAPAASTTTAPPQAPDSGFVAFGDFGGGPAQGAVAGRMTSWASTHRVDALVTTGDNVYEIGDPSLFDDYLDVPYATLRASRPLWVTLGNHDVAAGYGDEQLRYLGLPDLPYAKTLPDVQLLFLDANRPDVAQRDWLDARLSAPGPPLRVVVFHQPAYSCGPHGSTPGVDQQWVPLFEQHRVALVLTGHDHLYERFTSARGVTYVVTGGGGRGLYLPRAQCTGVPTKNAEAVRHHFTAVEVRGTRLTLRAVADDGTVLDTATITR